MGLDWNIKVNGEEILCNGKTNLACNAMTLDPYLDGTTARMVADLGMSPYWPLYPANTQIIYDEMQDKLNLTAIDMRIIAQSIANKAKCAEHLRIAAWLWTWAEEDEPDHRITCYMSY